MTRIAGEWENLEGRAIIYAKLQVPKNGENYTTNNSNESNEEISLGLYLATNPVDFKEKTGAPQAYFDHINKSLEQFDEKIKETLGKQASFFPVFARIYPVLEDAELNHQNEDIFYVGKFSHPFKALDAIMNGFELYVLNFHEQMEKEIAAENGNRFKTDPMKTFEANIKTYESFKGEDIKKEIMNYAGRLMTLRASGSIDDLQILKKEFLKFSEGAPFFMDSFELYKVIMNKKDEKLISLIIDKISAIHLEDYETATKLRDEIKKFEAGAGEK